MWPAIFNVLSASICILSAVAAIYAALHATRAPASLARSLRSVELRQQSTETSLNELSVELEALAQRVKMQRVRNATNHATSGKSSPDPYTEPDRWRAEMNKRLGLSRFMQPEK